MLKIGDKVIDLMESHLVFGKIINIEAHHGDQPYTMLTVDFGFDQVFDRYPNEIMALDAVPITKYEPRIVDVLDMEHLPVYLKDRIYATASEVEHYLLADYLDGDFHFVINFEYGKYDWLDMLKEMLPVEVVERDKFAIKFYQ